MSNSSRPIDPDLAIDRTVSSWAQTLLQDRYRDELPAPANWNDTLDVLLSHRSVRAYLPDALPPGTVETLVAAAQSAPSSSNLQTWSVIAVEDPARKARLAELAGNQGHIRQAPLLLVWLVDLNRLSRLAETRGESSEALNYLDNFLVGAIDAALAAQNAVVALESLGLGSVYIGAIRNRPAEVAAELGLPPKVVALFGLVVGRPDPDSPASVKPRLPQDVVLFREQYTWGKIQLDAIAAYDRNIRTFQREQGQPELDWSATAVARVRDATSLHGRQVLREVLQGLGFDLR
jgi:nitroreductase